MIPSARGGGVHQLLKLEQRTRFAHSWSLSEAGYLIEAEHSILEPKPDTDSAPFDSLQEAGWPIRFELTGDRPFQCSRNETRCYVLQLPSRHWVGQMFPKQNHLRRLP